MPSVPQMIRSVTQQKHIQQYIVEKDYALSYLLAAIDQADGLGENLVLKGDTALKKFYFANYRFSEDLDYSTRKMGPVNQIDKLMETVVHIMGKMLNERGPFQTELEPLVLKQPHPGDQKAYTVRVQFPEQRQALCRLKVKITVDEPILTPVNVRPILHRFAEDMEVRIPVYSLAEITAEILRALLQCKTSYILSSPNLRVKDEELRHKNNKILGASAQCLKLMRSSHQFFPSCQHTRSETLGSKQVTGGYHLGTVRLVTGNGLGDICDNPLPPGKTGAGCATYRTECSW